LSFSVSYSSFAENFDRGSLRVPVDKGTVKRIIETREIIDYYRIYYLDRASEIPHRESQIVQKKEVPYQHLEVTLEGVRKCKVLNEGTVIAKVLRSNGAIYITRKFDPRGISWFSGTERYCLTTNSSLDQWFVNDDEQGPAIMQTKAVGDLNHQGIEVGAHGSIRLRKNGEIVTADSDGKVRIWTMRMGRVFRTIGAEDVKVGNFGVGWLRENGKLRILTLDSKDKDSGWNASEWTMGGKFVRSVFEEDIKGKFVTAKFIPDVGIVSIEEGKRSDNDSGVKDMTVRLSYLPGGMTG